MTLQSKIFFLTRKYTRKIILDRKKTCQGQAETVHAEVSFYNTPQYLTLDEE